MARAISQYLYDLTKGIGEGWNRFWYVPRDPMTLGVLRFCTGMMALYLHVSFSFDLVRLFGDGGLLPVEVVRQLGGSERTTFSYLDYLTSSDELWIAHVAGFVVLVLFTVGWYSRLTSVLALLVMLAYIHRGPMLTGQVEPVVAMLLFYLCLGPSGACFSVDQWRAQRNRSVDLTQTDRDKGSNLGSTAANISIRLIQVHLCVIYLMMGVSKLHEPDFTWWQGEAVWWLIAKPESRLMDLTWLHEHIYIINAWTHSIVLFELIFSIMIWNRLARPLLLVVAVPIWASLALISGLVPFCLTMLIANLAFVSSDMWRVASGKWRVASGEPSDSPEIET